MNGVRTPVPIEAHISMRIALRRKSTSARAIAHCAPIARLSGVRGAGSSVFAFADFRDDRRQAETDDDKPQRAEHLERRR